MDAVLCLRETTQFQSMELERPEAIRGLESGTRSRLWCTRGDCARREEVAFFGLRFAGTEIACLNQFGSEFSWLQICRHQGDHKSNVNPAHRIARSPCPHRGTVSVKSVVARKRNGSMLTHSSAGVQLLNGLRCQGWERCLVQALIQSQQPVAPSLGVRPDQKISKNSSTAQI